MTSNPEPRWRRVAREPLVHFLALGALVFLLDALLGAAPPPQDPERRIVVDEQRVAWLRDAWGRQWRRPPTDAELRELIDAYVREEVLYREALAMGLDRDDTIVRRRLVQKLEFLTEDGAAGSEPSDAALDAYAAANRERYAVPPRLSFTHVFFNAEQRGPDAGDEARAVLEDLRSADPAPARAPERGDRFMLQTDYRRKTESEIAMRLGDEFARALFALEGEGWQGPIGSGFGLHLVRISERVPGREPDLEKIRRRIATDYVRDQRQQAKDALYERLKDQYEIVVDEAALAARPTASTAPAPSPPQEP